jgi:alkanesulfonate monooxygenase SsuD/methylene tetrahydromethanopterin reductase-like flavin-dependent oxidoreductase (luciferase family)
MKVAVAQMRLGLRRTGLLPPEEASRFVLDGPARYAIGAFTRHYVEGGPETVRRQLHDVAQRYQTNELIIATNCYAFEDRVRSFELAARALVPSQSPAQR